MDVNNAKAAELFDQIAEAMTALAGTFRASSKGGSGKADDDKPVGRKQPAKSSAKVEARGEVEEHTVDTVRAALKKLAELRGKEVMVSALESVGAGSLGDVDESQYDELVAKVNELMEEEPEEAPKPAAKKPAAKGKATKKGPTLEEAAERFAKLAKADRAAAKRVAKALDIARFSEYDGDPQEAIDAIAAEETEEEEDDLL